MAASDELVDLAKQGDVEGVRRLLESDRRVAGARLPSGETAIMAALYRGHLPIVGMLVEAGAPLDVFAAAALGRMEALERALTESADAVGRVAYDGWTPLHLAAFFGRTDAVATLIAAGARLDAESHNSMRNTPLHAALAGNHPEIALLLIEAGAPVAARDAGGHTPLHIAAEIGSLAAVRALLSRGADPYAVDGEDKTPVSRAAARNHSAVIDALNLEA